MPATRTDCVIDHLRRTVGVDGPSDAELLERYIQSRDDRALETLVRRHGPMVLGVCRRVLRDEHEAEDAFQAAFLALAREAGSLGRRGSVGGWLHRAACRLAVRARGRAVRRAARERPLAEAVSRLPEPGPQAAARELEAALDEQIERLPARYREVLVLRCLAGRSAADVAGQLGCPVGTVESRLTRARQRLRDALTRRGFAVPAGLLAGPTLAAAAPRSLARLLVAGAALAAALVTGAALLCVQPSAGRPAGVTAVKPAPQGDLAKLQGRWKLVKLEPARFHRRQEVVWHVQGNAIRVLLKGKERLRIAFTLDEKATPRRIDLVIPQADGSKKTVRGIYKVEKDTLTVCEPRPDRDRPEEFRAATEGPFPSVAVYRR